VSASYQLLPPLTVEERAALKADIAARGIMVPVEVDEAGAILDGHNRAAIAAELGIEAPTVTRAGLSEAQKREHVLKLNLLRRQLGPIAWADAFRKLAAERGIRLGVQGRQKTDTVSVLAAELGVNDRTARRRLRLADDVVRWAPDLASAIDAGDVAADKAKDRIHRARVREIAASIEAQPAPLPAGPFRVIVADPPWLFQVRAEDATHRARVQYPTMTVDEIAALPVAALAHDDAILWLWTTNAHLEDALGVCRAWGFAPRTVLTWVKDRMGMGNWLRGQTEHCILSVRGRPAVRLTNQTTLLTAPTREHSRKPDAFYALVDQLCVGRKLDWYSREPREGWAQYGNEPEAFVVA